MTVFDLQAKLTLDTTEYETGVKKAGQSSSVFASVLKANLVTKGIDLVTRGLANASKGLVNFAKVSVQTGAQFDEAMSQVAATMGVSVDQIQDLRDFAQEMGAKTAFSATEAAQALNYMALAGYDAQKSMEMLPNVLNLAAAGGMDLALASDMITDAQSALGLTTAETTRMVDEWAAASSKSNTSVTQLGDAILTIGANAKTVSGGTQELATVLGVLADNGIKGSEAGTHLRNILLKMIPETKDAQAAWEKLGVAAYENGNLRALPEIFQDINKAMDDMGLTAEQRTQTINDMFKETDLAAVNALLGTSAERWDELAGHIDDAAGAAERMAETQLDNLNGDLTIMNSAAEGLKIQFADGINPAIRNVVQTVTKAISKRSTQKYLNDVGKKLGDVTQILTGKVMNAVPRLLKLFDNGGEKIKLFSAAFAGLAIAVKATVNPIGAAATALGILAGGLALNALTADDARKKYGKLTQAQRDNIDATLDASAAYNENREARDEQARSIDDETRKTRDLWGELQSLMDSEGKVAEANQDRARIIVDKLNEALGLEIQMEDGVISKNGEAISSNQELMDSIDQLIEKKRANALFDLAQANYDEAQKGMEGVQKTISELTREQSNLRESLDGLKAAADSYSYVAEKVSSPEEQINYANAVAKVKEAEASLREVNQQLAEANAAEDKYMHATAVYTEALRLQMEGDYAAMADLLANDTYNRMQHKVETGTITAEEIAELEANMNTAKETLARYQQKLEEGNDEYSEEQIQAMEQHVQELTELWEKAKTEGAEKSNEAGEEATSKYGEGVESAQGEVEASTSSVISAAIMSIMSRMGEFYAAGASAGSAWSSGFAANQHYSGGGSHSAGHFAIGLDYVPENNYPAMLHRGEAVLTAREADQWRRGESTGKNHQPVNISISAPVVLDGATIARNQYDFLLDLDDAHGASLIKT